MSGTNPDHKITRYFFQMHLKKCSHIYDYVLHAVFPSTFPGYKGVLTLRVTHTHYMSCPSVFRSLTSTILCLISLLCLLKIKKVGNARMSQ
jgi:hypothetical protein